MRADALPASLPPRGLSRPEAAAYVGVSPTTFDRMVADGAMPPAIRYRRRRIWDRAALDRAFGLLAGEAAPYGSATDAVSWGDDYRL